MKNNWLISSSKMPRIALLMYVITLAGCGGGGGSNATPGYLALSYFPFNVGDAYKYRSVDGSTSTTYLTEIDTISLTNSDYLIRHKDNTGTYDEANRVENNKIITVSSTDSSVPQGLLPITLYDLSLSENVEKVIDTKSNLPYPDIDNDGLPENITTLTVTQTLLPKETITVENIIYADCAKIKSSINLNIRTSTGINVTRQGIVTEWFAPAIGMVKSTSTTTDTGPGGSYSSTNTDELLKYDVSGIKGGDWTPPSITANAAQLTNQLQVPVTGVTESGATVTATSNVAVNSVTADINGNYSVNASLELNIQNTITVSAADFVKNVNTMTVSVIQDSIPPASVTVSSTPLNGSVALSWNPSSDANGIAEYRVINNSLPLGRTTGTVWSDASVNPGEKITYQVLAVDNAGNASIPNPTYVAIPPGGTGVFNTQFQLTWPANVGSFSSMWETPSLFVADVDNDGKRDVVVFSQTGGGDKYILTTFGPVSATSQFSLTAFTPFDAFVVPHLLSDVDNDSTLEILSPTGGGNMGPRILKWDTTSSVWSDIPQPTWTNSNIYYSAFGDMDGDGVLDLLGVKLVGDGMANQFETYIYRGLGDGTFNDKGTIATGITSADWNKVSSMRTADFNRDGIADVIFWDDTNLRIFLGQGSGSYLLSNTLPVYSCRYFRCNYLVADISGDGFPDIIYDELSGVVSGTPPRDVRVFINDGTGHFPTTSVATNIGASWEFTTGDLNGDGIPDLIVEDGGTTATIWWSAGNGSFSVGPAFPVSYYDKVIATDIDRDGAVDVVVYGGGWNIGTQNTGTEIKIFLNQ